MVHRQTKKLFNALPNNNLLNQQKEPEEKYGHSIHKWCNTPLTCAISWLHQAYGLQYHHQVAQPLKTFGTQANLKQISQAHPPHLLLKNSWRLKKNTPNTKKRPERNS